MRKIILIFVIFYFFSFVTNGQDIKLDLGPDTDITCFDEVQIKPRIINWTESSRWDIGLHSIQLVDDNIAYAVGGTWNESLIIKSNNKGKTWERLYCPKNTYLNKVYFLNKDTGFIAGGNSNGFLLKTTDGGLNWETKITTSNISSIDFINDTVGYAVTYGLIKQTIDGGETWNDIASPVFSYYDINFADSLFGIAVGRTDEASDNSGRLCITEDGGYTWKEISLNFAYSLFHVAHAGKKTFISTAEGMIITSDDHFKTWSIQNTETFSDLFDITFLNQDIGMSVGRNHTILTTKNGGKSWEREFTEYSGDLFSSAILNDSFRLVVGSYPFNFDKGTIIQYKEVPEDLKFEWTPSDYLSNPAILSPTIYPLKSIQYILNANSSSTGILLRDTININVRTPGVYAGEDTLITSSENVQLNALTELGRWELNSNESRGAFENVKFVNKDVGFIAGGQISGILMKTTDGGKTWKKKITNTKYGFTEMSFPNELCGYVAGVRGSIYKTVDGGETWDSLQTNTKEHLNSICFINQNIGYAAGDNGTVIKTIDGGISWENENINIPLPVTKVYFIDENKGFATPSFQNECAFLETFDGGKSWTKIIIPNFDFRINDIQFINDKIGFMLGGTLSPLCFLKTTDGGQTWKTFLFEREHYVKYSSMFFTDEFTGYICNSIGEIIKTVDGGVRWYIWHQFPDATLHSIFFRDKNNAVVVGNGIIGTYHAPPDIHFDWSPKINILNGESSYPIVFPSSTTTYYIKAYNNAGCITYDDINVTVKSSNGIPLNEAALANITISPNPSTDIINIEFNNATPDVYSIRIVNINGEICLQDNTCMAVDGKYSISHKLKPGTYFVEIRNSKEKIIKKIIVE